MPTLLVTGASGYLGRRVVARAGGWDVVGTYLDHAPPAGTPGRHVGLDLRDPDATRRLVEAVRPDAIVHTACSNQRPEHVAAIVPAAQAVAEASRSVGTRLVHVSSDVVFDGTAAPYDESAPVRPLGRYAAAKAETEAIVLAGLSNALVVRTSLIYGVDPPDHQTRWLLGAMDRGERVTLFTDELRCPVFVDDLADALVELAARDLTGVLHVAGPAALDRWTFGCLMVAWLGRRVPDNVVPGTSAASGLTRAADLRLDTRRAQAALGTRVRGLAEVRAKAPGPAAAAS
jgi:dTDP-4-dehydrorhamnose reductase